MLIALALQTSIRLFGFWADSSSDIHLFIADAFSYFFNQLPNCVIASPVRFWANRYCVAVPVAFLQYRTCCGHLVNPVYFG
jgi:hypothetical protein